MTNISLGDIQVNPVQSSSLSQVSIQNNEDTTIQLSSPLANAIINLNFTLADEPVLDGVTGALSITAQYGNGPLVTFPTMDLSSEYSAKIMGKFTKINVSLSDLAKADTVIIYVDQNINIK